MGLGRLGLGQNMIVVEGHSEFGEGWRGRGGGGGVEKEQRR